jgi:hypothetical protein
VEAKRLAEILPGRRVYAFACSTFVPKSPFLLDTFACRAVDACVGVFAGHDASVMAPLAGKSRVSERMETALFHLIDEFIDGEDDENSLVNIGRMFASADLLVEIDLPSEDPHGEGAFGWSSAAFLATFFKSLRVQKKAQE